MRFIDLGSWLETPITVGDLKEVFATLDDSLPLRFSVEYHDNSNGPENPVEISHWTEPTITDVPELINITVWYPC
jgi:hypothetical protein